MTQDGWTFHLVLQLLQLRHVLKMKHDKIGGAGGGSKRRRSGNGNGCNKTLPAVFNSHAR